MIGFRGLPAPGDRIDITVDGRPVAMARGRTLLAGLLARGAGGEDFHCAIGQCQRCLVRVDGRVRAACLYVPRGGETIETDAPDGRPPAWNTPEESR